MAQLTGPTQVHHGDTTVVDTTLKHALGTRVWDKDGNEYIYLKGVASVTINSVVSFDEVHQTALIAANAVGRVAVAMASVVADTYGWFMIYGKTTAKSDTVAADTAAYIDGTAGRVDDAAVAGDLIHGMIIRSADTANLATVELSYPYVDNITES